jgi:N-acetylglucosaminyldiphosphoundecaprenol N-acetyl-beta-D-mannosaminyltransferase
MCAAWREPNLLNLLRQTNVGFCDGVGVSLASRILYGQRINRITGCDLFFKLISLASRKDWSVYLLGASAESNAAAYSELQRSSPGLKIAGRQDGYFKNSQKVVEQINASGADLLFVAMGSPRQEDWICRHRHAIDAKFCMGVGGSFDVASGSVSRAPKLFCATGTEFLFRILSEPRKRWIHPKILFCYLLKIFRTKLSDVRMRKKRKPPVLRTRDDTEMLHRGG